MSSLEEMRHLGRRSAMCETSPDAAPALVTLAGAGPGDPELLTVKAAHAIASAEVVLYDNLVSPGVLALLPPQAERIYVGKASARHTMPQRQIIELMVSIARAGRPVLRLKGGDPYVFGRGGEEAEALADAGVPFVVIPGISAAQGAAAYAGIPLTHRDHAARMMWVTGHLREECDGHDVLALDWPALARGGQTLVVYMGVASLPVLSQRLQGEGLSGDTPAAIVENATLPAQRTIVGTLRTLPALAQAAQVRSPALIIVGSVVSLHEALHDRATADVFAPLLQRAAA